MTATFSGENYKSGGDDDFSTYKLHMMSAKHLRFFLENFGPLWDCECSLALLAFVFAPFFSASTLILPIPRRRCHDGAQRSIVRTTPPPPPSPVLSLSPQKSTYTFFHFSLSFIPLRSIKAFYSALSLLVSSFESF